MAAVASLLNTSEPEILEEIGTGRNEMLLKCTNGLYKDRFFYVSLNVREK